MESFLYYFPMSGVETYLFLPPAVMFLISSVASTGGVSGAFILLPFQMSVLGYTAPGVSATNFIYNVVAIPLGVYQHIREQRFSWTLFGILVFGTLPGVFFGYFVRVTYLADPVHFRFFAGLVLAYLGIKTLKSAYDEIRAPFSGNNNHARIISLKITSERIGFFRTTIRFEGQDYVFSTPLVFFLSLVVGVVGGAYGIGGGAIMSPFCVSVLRLPVYVVSGAALFSTWVTSVAGVLFYAFVPIGDNLTASPDWALGALFGLGGMAGIYVGARIQKRMPSSVIKLILGTVISFISIRYLFLALTNI